MSLNDGDKSKNPQSSVVSEQTDKSLVTEHYAGELDSLRLQSNQLHQLFDVMPAGVVIIDGDGKIVKANHIAKELMTSPLIDLLWIEVIRDTFLPQADDGHELSLKDGRRVKLDISSFSSQAGQLILITDLTETRMLQRQLSQMEKLSALGRMVATLAHQIRTPLSSALLYCSNLMNKSLTDEKKLKFHEKLAARLQDLEQQVNDMLLYAKSGSKQVVSILNIENFINEAVAGIEDQVTDADASISVDISDSKLQILGNKTALEGALHNLIQNSLQEIDFGAEISIRCYQQDNDVCIHVKDNGNGIDAEDAKNIFEPFYTSKVEGTGLGLAVVKSVAKAHHGDVLLVNTGSDGTEFCITLPLFENK
ncbi:sensor histidine kinase [Thalassotalea crassostreae]|uniref:sensor histidine kinase n=1 Tax=Thalassotalea crassostreae TaxID=1763536 RepID=UPI0008394206|nr:ATP-binding protein [Thalassotalea crassostreae]